MFDPATMPLPAGMFNEIAEATALGIKGRVVVDIIDDRTGHVLDRQEAPNYVNATQWQRYAKWAQKAAWFWALSPATIGRTVKDRDPRNPPRLSNDAFACWTDSTAEDQTDLYPLGDIVAWAHRWSQGSPGSRQGLVQPSLCTITDDSITWVWEWTTQNGNGTFQSVGWRRLKWASSTADGLIGDAPNFSRRMFGSASYSDAVSLTGNGVAWNGTNLRSTPLYYNSADSKLYSCHDTASNRKLVSMAITIDPTTKNLSIAGPVTDESANVLAAGLGGDSISSGTRHTEGITRLGPAGDWIAVGHTGSTTSRRPFIRRVTAAGAVTYTNVNVGTYPAEAGFMDVTYDGTNLWVVAINPVSGPRVHRIDPATGTISATLTLSALPVGLSVSIGVGVTTQRVWTSIEWDATNSWLWLADNNGNIWNIDTSGVWQGACLRTTAFAYVTTTAPQSGNATDILGYRQLSDVDNFNQNFQAASGAVPADPFSVLWAAELNGGAATITAAGRFTIIDGDIWCPIVLANHNTAPQWNLSAFTQEPCFATRSLLTAPVTKGGTQTMRISYTLTFV